MSTLIQGEQAEEVVQGESSTPTRAASGIDLPPGRIRRYEHKTDGKVLRFLIGSSILTQTAMANQRQFWGNWLVYVWTIGFTLYVAFRHLLQPASFSDSSLPFIKFSLAFVVRLPLFFAPPLILLALINALNRSYFRAVLVQAFGRVDLREPSKYYAGAVQVDREPNTDQEHTTIHPTMWILDYDGRQLGVVAIDTDLDDLEELVDPKRRTILIRHLATAPDFRLAGIDQDLLMHARSLVFGEGYNADRLAVRFCPVLDDHLLQILTQLGFSRLPLSFNHSSTTLQYEPFFKNKTLLKLLGHSNPFHPWPQETWVLDRENKDSVKSE